MRRRRVVEAEARLTEQGESRYGSRAAVRRASQNQNRIAFWFERDRDFSDSGCKKDVENV